MNKNLKNLHLKKINIFFLFPRPPQRKSKLQKNPSALKREHPALEIQHIHEISLLFSISVGQDPEPDSESGSADRIKSGSNPDPDLESGYKTLFYMKLPPLKMGSILRCNLFFSILTFAHWLDTGLYSAQCSVSKNDKSESCS
jgi:hypothetical protein